MKDPVCESAHYIATIQNGELRLVLVQHGQPEPVDLAPDRVSGSELERPHTRHRDAWGVIRRVLGLLL